jgi:hypothetical protein
MLKLDKKEHLVIDHHQRVGRLGRSKQRIFISRKGQEEVTLMLQKTIKIKLQATEAIELISSPSPNGNQETEAISRLAATKKLGVVPSARRKIVGLEHLGTLLVSRSVKGQHEVSLAPSRQWPGIA